MVHQVKTRSTSWYLVVQVLILQLMDTRKYGRNEKEEYYSRGDVDRLNLCQIIDGYLIYSDLFWMTIRPLFHFLLTSLLPPLPLHKATLTQTHIE